MHDPSSRFYITTPIYYVNAKPHLGTAYTSILSDIFNRYHRFFGKETFFLTGLDEHGQKCQQAAEERGLDPKKHCDEMSLKYQEAWKTLNIQYDLFFRTTHRYSKNSNRGDHTTAVRQALQKLKDQGDIYKGVYEGWYSVSEEIFYAQKDLIDGKSPLGKEVIPIKEENYFFRMSRYQNRLKEHLEENPHFIYPSFRQNELKGFLRNPLQDLCISRSKKRVSWGIELPFDSNYVAYVWVDALLNYITGVGFGGGVEEDNDSFKKWWMETGAVHFIGKDILITHGIYWPSLLMALGFPLPKTIVAHGWLLNKEREKMSKSEGDILNPLDMVKVFGVDGLRYFLAREIPIGKDAAILKELIKKRINQDLTYSVGNILSRLTHLLQKRFKGCIPKGIGQFKSSDKEEEILREKLVRKTEKLCSDFKDRIENFQLSEALKDLQDVLKEVNVYLEKTAPWKLPSDQDQKAGLILYTSLEVLRICGTLLFPVMPEKMNLLLKSLKSEDSLLKNPSVSNLKWGGLKEGTVLKATTPLFPKL